MNKKNKKNKVSTSYSLIDDIIIRKQIFFLIIFSLLFKLLTIIITIFGFQAVIDYFDLRTYVVKSTMLVNGQIPYISFYHEYPFLAIIPNILAGIPPAIFNNLILTFTSFQLLMIIFDVLTTICIYFIALKVYNSNKTTAFMAGVIYTLSLCAAYTTLTRFDSFPVFLMVASIYMILYRQYIGGYLAIVMGFFTKIFPVVALPFLLIYERESIKERIKLNVLLYSIFSIILVIPFIFIIGLDKTLKPYLFATGSNLSEIYVNTFTFTIYSWLHLVFNLPIDFETISIVFTAIMILSVLCLLFISYKMEKMTELNLIQFIGASLLLFVVFTKFHSPQYFMWFTPFFAILVAEDMYKMGIFFIVQFLAFMEFPLMYGHYYTNINYTNTNGTANWYITLIFFTIEYIFIFFLLKINLQETIKYNLNQYIRGEIK